MQVQSEIHPHTRHIASELFPRARKKDISNDLGRTPAPSLPSTRPRHIRRTDIDPGQRCRHKGSRRQKREEELRKFGQSGTPTRRKGIRAYTLLRLPKDDQHEFIRDPESLAKGNGDPHTPLMNWSHAPAFLFTLIAFSSCGEKAATRPTAQSKPSTPSLPPVVQEIPDSLVPLWPQVADAFSAGPEALDTLYRSFEGDGAVDADGRWNAIVMVEWFNRASEHFPMPAGKENVLAKLRQWQTLAPDRAGPRVAEAQLWIGLGWDIRGNDWGPKVAKEKMKAFQEHIVMAAEALAAVAEKNRDVAYYYTLLELARPGSLAREEFDKAAREAVRLFPTCPHIGGSIFHYLAPRWHGRPGEWEPYLRDIAREAAGPDAAFFYSLAVIEGYKIAFHYNGMAAEMIEGATFENQLLVGGLDRIAATFPKSTLYASGEACLRAFALNDPRASRRALARAGGVVDLRFWNQRAMYDEIATWTARRLGEK